MHATIVEVDSSVASAFHYIVDQDATKGICMTGMFAGKVALVTGAGGGIGLASAKAFAEAGASVIVADRNAETIGKAAEALRSAGHNAIGVVCDVTDRAQVTRMVDQAVANLWAPGRCLQQRGDQLRGRVLAGNERRRVRPHHQCQSSRRLELHEGGTSPDDGAGKRRNRQLFIDWRNGGFEGTECLFGQ